MAIKRSPYALVALAGALFCVAASTVPTAVTETESPTQAPGECEQYCSGSYPKHTYPEVNLHSMVPDSSSGFIICFAPPLARTSLESVCVLMLRLYPRQFRDWR